MSASRHKRSLSRLNVVPKSSHTPALNTGKSARQPSGVFNWGALWLPAGGQAGPPGLPFLWEEAEDAQAAHSAAWHDSPRVSSGVWIEVGLSHGCTQLLAAPKRNGSFHRAWAKARSSGRSRVSGGIRTKPQPWT